MATSGADKAKGTISKNKQYCVTANFHLHLLEKLMDCCSSK
jgi:hypothetical protein